MSTPLLVHAFFLAALDLGAILAGFGVWKVSGVAHQLSVQLPIAMITVVIVFALWAQTMSRSGARRPWALDHRGRAALVLVLSMVLAPVIFVALHRLTQGYWTGTGNLGSLAAFQLPVNAVALGAAALLSRPAALPPALLFVYGTLRRGRPAQSRLDGRGRWLGEGSIEAELFEIDGYPGAVTSPAGGSRVFGDLFALNDAPYQLGELDRYEMATGPDREFVRTLIDVELDDGGQCKAWVYLYARPVRGHRRLRTGVWPERPQTAGALPESPAPEASP